MKIGLVGDRNYTNRRKIKDFIFLLKKKGGIEIVGCGGEWKSTTIELHSHPNNFVGDCVKNYTLEFDMSYSEFPPSHLPYNMYCALKPYHYGKPFQAWNYKIRDKQIVKYCDKMVIFKSTKSGNDLLYYIKESEKLNKPYILVEK